MMFKYHVLALLLGTCLEFSFGRIYGLWNPFDSIKRWIKYLDRALLGDDIILLEPSKQKFFGGWLVALTLIPTTLAILFFTMLCYEVSPVFGVIFEALASYYCLDANHVFYGARNVMFSYYGDGVGAMNYAAGLLTGSDCGGKDILVSLNQEKRII